MRLWGLRTSLAVVVFVAVTVTTGGAARAEGPGIKLGERLLLHPGVATEFRYDSNVFFQDSATAGAFMFRALTSLDLVTAQERAPSQVVDFRLHAGFSYNEYLTGDANIRRHRAFAVDASTMATLFPTGRLSLTLFDGFIRTSQPPYGNFAGNYDRDTNQLGVRLTWAPGSGRLSFNLGYAFGIDFFETPQLQDFNLFTHRIDARASWKVFPKTAVYVQADETIITYRQHQTYSHPDSYPFRAVVGLVGLLTVKLTLNASVGYGNGFYTSGPSPNSVVAAVDLNWKATPMTVAAIGYKHDFVNSLLGSYYDLDTAYLSLSQMIWRFIASARLSYQNQRFKGISAASAVTPMTGERTDHYISLNTRIDYQFRQPWLTASVGYDLQWNTSNSRLDFGPTLGLVPVNYLKHEVWLRLAVVY